MIEAFVFLFGLVFGSFLNVCIHRLPRHESVVTPGSHCPICQTPIRARDNIPVIGYLLLRGRCRSCGKPISPEYPLVELLTGALFLGCYCRFGVTLAGAKWTLFCAILLVLIFTDFHERILPNRVNYFGLGAGLALSPFAPAVDGLTRWLLGGRLPPAEATPLLRLSDSALGAVLAAGLLWLFAEGYFRLRGREGMGLGDVKMMAMAGAFLGVRQAIVMLMFGSIIGSVVGAVAVWGLGKGRDYELPFGSFLGIAGIFLIFAGGPLFHWYLSAAGISR
ncbi:MAG TPA: prepilin peptidase [Candidatus Dormibacteraeota bacterium]|nr:prepilin peptidase [Candidatus Dormibacteraeota bacterium]